MFCIKQDARAQEEFDVSHLDGALRVDYKDKYIEPLAQKCSEKLKGILY